MDVQMLLQRKGKMKMQFANTMKDLEYSSLHNFTSYDNSLTAHCILVIQRLLPDTHNTALLDPLLCCPL